MKRSWVEKIGDTAFGISVLTVGFVCVIGFAALVLPEEPVPPEDYLCLTYAGDHILTTDYELSQPGQMLFGKYLETKDQVWVNRVDLKVCGLTRQ